MRRVIGLMCLAGLLAACSSGDRVVSTTTPIVTTTAAPTTAAPATSDQAATTSAPAGPTTSLAPVGDIVAGTTLAGNLAFLGPVRRVQVGALQIGYRRFGSGPELVLVAGEGSGMDDWPVSWLREVANNFTVTMYDNRDLGYSSATAGRFTLDDLADDLAGLIAVLGLRQPAVFGWSTGGEIGLLLAARHPSALSKLAISGATGGGSLTVFASPAIERCVAAAVPSCDLLALLFSDNARGAAAKAKYVADYVRIPHPAAAKGAMARYVRAETDYNSRPAVDYSKITVPVLVTNGDVDLLVPVSNASVIAKQLGARATLYTDKGGAHAWFIQHPTRFLIELTKFLQR